MLQTGKRKILLIAISVILFVTLAAAAYAGDYYPAGELALSALGSDEEISVTVHDNGTVSFMPDTPHRGLIFYPGGKVEHTAYAPLLRSLAEEGWLCILVEMPLRLAVLDKNAASGIPERYPEIDSWYIGGHSLGGAMAASYAAEHTETFDGLILLGSYSTEDLRHSGLRIYSLYGSEDGVLNMENYEEYRIHLPEDTQELIIDGGCHAYCGDYGPQDGDGEPVISAMDQIALTVDFLTPQA